MILDTAKELTQSSRRGEYPHPLDDFTKTAKIWQAILGDKLIGTLTPEDVGLMMIGLKISREQQKHKLDNLVDIAGYAQTIEMVKDEKATRQLQQDTFSPLNKL